MASPRPVLLVHGAWHGAWCWASLQAALDRRGVPSYALDLPGRGMSAEPLGDLYADTARVEQAITTIGTDLVLVGHSYGGAVVSGAAANAAGGHVGAIVYLTAFALLEGETVMDIVGANTKPVPKLADAIIVGEDGVSVIEPSLAAESFYGSCPPDVVAAAVPRLSPQSAAAFEQPVKGSALGRLPTTYVRCTLDESINLPQQDMMAKRCDDVVTLEADHSPFISATDDVAGLIERLSTAARS